MSVTPLTPTGKAIAAAKRLLTSSATFLAGCGVNTAEDALQFIGVPNRPLSKSQNDKPFAVISPPSMNSLTAELIAGGGKHYFRLGGALDLAIYRDVVKNASEEDELIDFLNFAEGIWLDLLNLAGVNDHLALVGAPAILGPIRTARQKSGQGLAQRPFYKVVYALEWK